MAQVSFFVSPRHAGPLVPASTPISRWARRGWPGQTPGHDGGL